MPVFLFQSIRALESADEGVVARPVQIEDRTSWTLQEVAVRSLVALRSRMTPDQFVDAMDLVEQRTIDPMGCDQGRRSG